MQVQALSHIHPGSDGFIHPSSPKPLIPLDLLLINLAMIQAYVSHFYSAACVSLDFAAGAAPMSIVVLRSALAPHLQY